jgi:hypothetical protein
LIVLVPDRILAYPQDWSLQFSILLAQPEELLRPCCGPLMGTTAWLPQEFGTVVQTDDERLVVDWSVQAQEQCRVTAVV